jgi:hypothetical protein
VRSDHKDRGVKAMSKENLILAQILKQADKGRWFSRSDLEKIFKVYDVKWSDMQALVKKLKKRGLV